MFTKKSILTLLISAVSLGFISCSDDDKKRDTEGPVIELLTPANDTPYARGSAISIDAKLSDESGIGSYKIDIHSAGDGHGHGHEKSADLRSATDSESGWSTDGTSYVFISKNLNGEKNVHVNHTTSVIPANTKSGEYHLGIQAIDINGNETKSYIDIIIE